MYKLENWNGINMIWDYVKNFIYWDKKNVLIEKIYVIVVKDINVVLNLYNINKLDCVEFDGEFVK